MIRKLFGSFSLLVLVWMTLPARAAEPPAAPACKPVQIAEGTQCVKDQLKSLRAAKTYNETTTVTDNAESVKTVTFIFEPKCLRAPTPCRIASRSVTSTVDCKTATATCP